MAKPEKKDNKELSQDKSPKKAVKSSYSKKKKTKKNILNGIAYVNQLLITQLFQSLTLMET